MKRLVMLALLLTGATCALAQEDPPVDCANAMSQADMNQCSYMDFEKADKELNAVYKDALKKAAEADQQAAEMGPGYVGAVKDSTDTWYAGWTCNSATLDFGATSSACTTLPTS